MKNKKKRRRNKRYETYKRDGLHSKVDAFPAGSILKDHQGRRYIPYCDHGFHQGLIRDISVCKTRHCRNYYRLYIESSEYSE